MRDNYASGNNTENRPSHLLVAIFICPLPTDTVSIKLVMRLLLRHHLKRYCNNIYKGYTSHPTTVAGYGLVNTHSTYKYTHSNYSLVFILKQYSSPTTCFSVKRRGRAGDMEADS